MDRVLFLIWCKNSTISSRICIYSLIFESSVAKHLERASRSIIKASPWTWLFPFFGTSSVRMKEYSHVTFLILFSRLLLDIHLLKWQYTLATNIRRSMFIARQPRIITNGRRSHVHFIPGRINDTLPLQRSKNHSTEKLVDPTRTSIHRDGAEGAADAF